MEKASSQSLPVFAELEKRVRSLNASEQALGKEVKTLRGRLAETESELERWKARSKQEQGRRRQFRGRLDAILGRLAELPALKEEA